MLNFVPTEGNTGRTGKRLAVESVRPWKGQQRTNLSSFIKVARAELGGCRESQVVLSLADRAGPASWKHR